MIRFYVVYCAMFDKSDRYETMLFCRNMYEAYLTAHREAPDNYFVEKIYEN